MGSWRAELYSTLYTFCYLFSKPPTSRISLSETRVFIKGLLKMCRSVMNNTLGKSALNSSLKCKQGSIAAGRNQLIPLKQARKKNLIQDVPLLSAHFLQNGKNADHEIVHIKNQVYKNTQYLQVQVNVRLSKLLKILKIAQAFAFPFKYVNPFGIIPKLLQFCLAKGRVCMSHCSPPQALPPGSRGHSLFPCLL